MRPAPLARISGRQARVSSCQPKTLASNWARQRVARQILDRARLAIGAVVEQRIELAAGALATSPTQAAIDGGSV